MAETRNMTTRTATTEYLYAAQLKARGWTGRLVAAFFPEPHATRANPRYRSAAPMKLYRKEAVEAAEATPEFAAAKAKSAVRSEAAKAAKAAAGRRREATLASIEAFQADVPAVERGRLIRLAVRHYNDRQFERSLDRGRMFDLAGEDSDPKFLARICVNYLRHCRTDYESQLGDLFGRVGVGEAYALTKAKVLDAIAEKHPWLAGECRRQKLGGEHYG